MTRPAAPTELLERLQARGIPHPAGQRAAVMAMRTPRKAAERLEERRQVGTMLDAGARATGSIPPTEEAEALEAALEELDRCRRCGTELTDPVSIRRGLGPDCAKVAR